MLAVRCLPTAVISFVICHKCTAACRKSMYIFTESFHSEQGVKVRLSEIFTFYLCNAEKNKYCFLKVLLKKFYFILVTP